MDACEMQGGSFIHPKNNQMEMLGSSSKRCEETELNFHKKDKVIYNGKPYAVLCFGRHKGLIYARVKAFPVEKEIGGELVLVGRYWSKMVKLIDLEYYNEELQVGAGQSKGPESGVDKAIEGSETNQQGVIENADPSE